LHELDLDATGIVDEQNLEDSLKVLKHLKKGMDTDGSGHVSNSEMEQGVELLTKLMKEKANNASEMPYKHLPECIQDVMREWDADGSGMVGVSELSAAASAYKKVQQEGRMMRKIIFGMAMVILILMASMFILSWAAVEMAKEMKGDGAGVMATPDGVVVKVGSSDFEMTADGTLIIRGTAGVNATCPEGTTCRRLMESSGGALRVASAEQTRRLSSTLPDSTFRELKQLTLKDNNNHSLKVTISSFSRLYLRSSRCGSVIQLNADQGTITLDDYDMIADETMEAYAKDAGMGALFEDGPASGFGRRLSSTDGLLEGFFNMLENVEWECESVELPNPNDMPQFYYAKMEVKHLHGQPERAYSFHFTDPEVDPLAENPFLMLPGTIKENGKIYKTWTEELVKSASLTAYMSHYAMHPFQRELRLKKGSIQAKVEAMGHVGYRCLVESPQNSTISSAQGGLPSLEFRGVVQENGMVLRHWRIDPMGDLEREGNLDAHEMQISMMKAGLIPDTVDYFDVDTDPTGKFESGQPYRVRMWSSVEGSKVDTTKQYVEIIGLPSAFETSGMFEYFNVTMLDEACAFSRELQNMSATEDAYVHATMLKEEVEMLTRTNRSSTSTTFSMPPEIRPWTEFVGDAVLWNYNMLKRRASSGELTDERLVYARKFRYWDALFTSRANEAELLRNEFFDQYADTYNNTNFTNSSTMNLTSPGGRRLSDGRRLARRLGKRSDVAADGSYFVEITEDDLLPNHADHPMRRMSARRLDDDAPFWKYKAWVTPEKIDIEVEAGAASLQFLVQYCNLWNPTATNWGACQTGRAGGGDIVKLEAYCSGKQMLFPFPKVSLEVGGLLVYDDTSAMGMETDVNIHLAPVVGRGKVLGMNGWSYTFYDPNEGGSKGTWQLRSADGGIGVIGSDARVWIRNSDAGRYIQDNNGNARVTSNNRGWEKFKVLDAGNGRVYLMSHRGDYLGVEETGPQPSGLTCTVKVYRDRYCRGSSWTFSTTSTSGYEPRGKGNNEQKWGRRRWGTSDDEWYSASASGDCALVEFYDEDESESGYEDNMFKFGNFDCADFKDEGHSDIADDLGGIKITAKGPDPPEFEGRLVLYDSPREAAMWRLTKTGDGSSIISFGDALLYGGLTFSKDVEIIWDIGASWTTEIGAAGAVHSTHGVYLAEVYGKTIFEITPAQIYLLLKFNPEEPWKTKYKKWKMYVGLGYEIDAFVYTFRDEYEVHTSSLNF